MYASFIVLGFAMFSAAEKRVLLNDEDLVAIIHQNQAEIQALKATVATLSAESGQGSTYIRWGRTSCPGHASLIYKGYAGGNWFTTSGGAADFLCLPDDPTWGHYDDSAQSHMVKLFGAEYQFGEHFSDGGAQFFGQNLMQHDVPCAACRTDRPTTMMIPGRFTCYPGWTLEYKGYLVSGNDGHSSSTNYACLDSRSVPEAGDYQNENGRLMYLVEAQCGTLKCPPYVQNREMSCVVCSK